MLVFVIAPAFAAAPLPVELELARRALLHHREGAANEALRGARESLTDAPLLVPGAELARLHYLTGVAAWSTGLQSQAMTAWRQMWQIAGYAAAEDDGLLDDEGMAVLRALRNEGGSDEVGLALAGDTDGVLVLVDGQRRDDGARIPVGDHLLQVRCPDGAVSSTWSHVTERVDLRVDCPRRGRGGAGVNEAVLGDDADPDLVQIALFGAYRTDAAMRLGQLPPDGAVEAEPEPPPEPRPAPPPSAPASAQPPSQAPPEPEPEPEPADPAECAGAALTNAAVGASAWEGAARTTPERGGQRATDALLRWLRDPPPEDLGVRLEAEGSYGLRVRYAPATRVGLAVRVRPGLVELVELPGTLLVSREVETAGVHVLRVEVRGTRVVVRLDDAMVLGGSASAFPDGTVAVEAEPGAWVGRVRVCR